MAMVKKSILITDQQDEWIKAQVESGRYGNESDVFQDLIQERQLQRNETPEEVAVIRAALIEGEQSSVSDPSVDEVIEEARARRSAEKLA